MQKFFTVVKDESIDNALDCVSLTYEIAVTRIVL